MLRRRPFRRTMAVGSPQTALDSETESALCYQMRRHQMTTDEAQRVLNRLRSQRRWRKRSMSDLEFLRSEANTNESLSLIFAVVLFGKAGQAPYTWVDIWLLFLLVAFVFCRMEASKCRAVLRLFEDNAPQMLAWTIHAARHVATQVGVGQALGPPQGYPRAWGTPT